MRAGLFFLVVLTCVTSARTQKLQKARVDRLAEVHGETLFHSFIYDHSEQKMFAVFFRGEVATSCFLFIGP